MARNRYATQRVDRPTSKLVLPTDAHSGTRPLQAYHTEELVEELGQRYVGLVILSTEAKDGGQTIFNFQGPAPDMHLLLGIAQRRLMDDVMIDFYQQMAGKPDVAATPTEPVR